MKDLNTGGMDVKLRIFLTSKKGEWSVSCSRQRQTDKQRKEGWTEHSGEEKHPTPAANHTP
jgi:hypothetical protein